MVKVNPLLEKKIFGISVNELIGISCGATCGTTADNWFKVENLLLNFLVFIAAWVIGFVLWLFVISMVKTYITKEE